MVTVKTLFKTARCASTWAGNSNYSLLPRRLGSRDTISVCQRHYLTVPETLSLKTTCDTIVGGDTIASVVSRSSLCTSPPSSRYTPWLLLKTGRESICSSDNLKCKFCTLWQNVTTSYATLQNITKRDNNYVNCAAIRQSLFTQGGPTKPKNIET